jgi:hypothetical protein
MLDHFGGLRRSLAGVRLARVYQPGFTERGFEHFGGGAGGGYGGWVEARRGWARLAFTPDGMTHRVWPELRGIRAMHAGGVVHGHMRRSSGPVGFSAGAQTACYSALLGHILGA